jgi:hypothetical protein
MYDNRFGMPWKTPIQRSEYENMGGRAGRYGSGTPFGRSILIAVTQYDETTLWRRYVDGEREKVEPRLAKEPLENHVLRLVASRSCLTEAELHAFFEKTLTGTWVWAETVPLEETEFRVRAAINRAIDTGMITRDGEGKLWATPLGQAVSSKGISIATAQELAHWLHESETRIWSDLDLILAAALTVDGRMLQVTLTSREYDRADYPSVLKRLTLDEDSEADVPLNRLRNSSLLPFFEEVRAIKIALFLTDWIDESSIYDIEEKYHTLLGQIVSAAEQVSWIIDATAALATAFGAQEDFIERVSRLAERVQYGLREEGLVLARLRLPGLERGTIIALETKGLHTPSALAGAPAHLLDQWVPAATAHELKSWGLRNTDDKGIPPGREVTPPSSLPVLVVDDRRPNEIVVEGKRVKLQDKQYRLVRALAGSPGECIPYDTIYEEIWGETIVEQNQMHFQKRRLLAGIKEVAPHRASVVRTIPKRGFVLDLRPAEVALLPALTAV